MFAPILQEIRMTGRGKFSNGIATIWRVSD
jgi:hypothetical protein